MRHRGTLRGVAGRQCWEAFHQTGDQMVCAAWPELLRQHQIEQTIGGASPHEELLAYFRSRGTVSRPE